MYAHYPHRAFIGIGSNLNNPLEQVQRAITALARLPLCEMVAVSPLYRTQPVGPQDQDDFINGAVELLTAYSPLALLDQLQRLEQQQRRIRVRHWGPRTLDLDLLLYDEQIMDHARLQVPHKEFLKRPFAWKPVIDIAPDVRLPDGSYLHEYIQMGDANDMVQIGTLSST
ncbi:2-amino-4-hydroxy-6-hydroxymethyldihydropteridine pyrophosphokinase [Halomonadaceae bacterium LMG 33818]|uniref:2-amino-4-hydroxy-6- hydroxymethyldihydropteridine diphosphokinase n=1 Tax=Cernens ardua TaxID=3402176 RepID=UPI003EDC4579